ncbi:unnamed protein product [Cuscuta campestris]|uniref:Thioredoxin-like fold domain-containing protein n=1 Tax=Cuscuta campestris TaxID=132261 RepID=A0A484MDU8_9ASTE|nr:unnamed protein product [Cuscuta campestris]
MGSGSIGEMGFELGPPSRMDVQESGSSGIDDADSRSSSEMNGMPEYPSKKQKIGEDGMDPRLSSWNNIPLFSESMEVELGCQCMDVPESGFSGIDDVDPRSSSEMNGRSGYLSKNHKIGEDCMDARLFSLHNVPLLSDICEMKCIRRTFGEQVHFDLETLCGKYVLFYSFVPSPSNYRLIQNSLYPNDLFDLCADLYSARDDFEMVFVAKSRKQDDLQLYYYGLPSYSLVVPFEESGRPNIMREFHDLVDPGTFKCLFLNVNKNISVRGNIDSMSRLTEHLQELIQESPFDCLRSFQRILKRLWPVIPQEQKNPFPREGFCPIARKLNAVKLEYGKNINEMVSDSMKLFPTKIGQSFDVISLLSGKGEMKKHLVRKGGDRVVVDKQTFSGKYIMICCFNVPVFRHEQTARYAQALATACSELYSSRNDFEMVVVAKMNQLANYEVYFNHFLSGFPTPCLVVPFEDSERRDFICKYLDLRACYDIGCLILEKDTDSKRNILFCESPYLARTYGADAFPFTTEKLQEVSANDHMWWDGDVPPPANLEELLGCNPCDILHKTPSPGDHEEATILELSRKVVGVYACVSGDLIPTLGKVYQQCRAEEKEFEIVLVYIPLFADSLDPQVHMANIVSLLQEWGISWWQFPPSGNPNKLFNSSVSFRVSRCLCACRRDRIIIVGRDGSFVEPGGREILSKFGVDGYPFSSECVVGKELEKLEKLTMESLLVPPPPRDFVYKEKKKIHVSELRGKKILLYLNRFGDFCLAEKVRAWYSEMKGTDPNVEVVVVCRFDYIVMADEGDESDVTLSELLPFWHVCPFDPQHSASLVEVLFKGGCEFDALIEFGTDGRVCSMKIASGTDDLPLDIVFDKSQLRDDITSHFRFKGFI